MARFAVVGGGMLGMTLALRLLQAGHEAVVFEAAERCGGLAAPWQLGDITWDRHYHVISLSDLALRGVIEEIGLRDHLQWNTTRTGFFVDGRLHSLSHVRDFLRFPPLSVIEKARLAATILKASRISDWRALEEITAIEWLTKHSGRNTVEKLWLPLLRAKLGTNAQHASAAFIWAVIVRMYAARRTGAKRELFGYVRGGYDRILYAFEDLLVRKGANIRTSHRVSGIEMRGNALTVTSEAGEERFDSVVVTLAAPLVPRICPSLSARERELCSGVQYQGIVCASLLADAPLSPYYITNITDSWVPFTAVIEMDALVGADAFGGRALMYFPRYLPSGDPSFARSDQEYEAEFLAALERMHPRFTRRSVRAFRISRVSFVMPVPTLHYSSRLPPVRTSIPGLYLANSAHIVNGTLNVNETITLANRVAGTLIADASGAPSGVAV